MRIRSRTRRRSNLANDVRDPDQDNRADGGDDDRADRAVGARNPERAEDPSADQAADQPQQEIADQAVACATHQLTGQPARDNSDYDRTKHRGVLLVVTDRASTRRAPLLFLFHRNAATLELSGAGLGDDDLGLAIAADINFAELICHSWILILSDDLSLEICAESLRAPEQRFALLQESAHAFGAVGSRL